MSRQNVYCTYIGVQVPVPILCITHHAERTRRRLRFTDVALSVCSEYLRHNNIMVHDVPTHMILYYYYAGNVYVKWWTLYDGDDPGKGAGGGAKTNYKTIPMVCLHFIRGQVSRYVILFSLRPLYTHNMYYNIHKYAYNIIIITHTRVYKYIFLNYYKRIYDFSTRVSLPANVTIYIYTVYTCNTRALLSGTAVGHDFNRCQDFNAVEWNLFPAAANALLQ